MTNAHPLAAWLALRNSPDRTTTRQRRGTNRGAAKGSPRVPAPRRTVE
ncbi:hypothetical protein [Nocardioides guangzhouensis]|nr:hypothetical protein [Nocardioides guangzhouensis]